MARLFGRMWTREELERSVGRFSQIAGFDRYRLSGGRSEGVEIIRLRTGSGLEIEAVAGRNLDIAGAWFNGTRLSWQSPNGIANAAYCDPTGTNFSRTFFGGMVTTCGLRNFGPPSEDQYGSVGQHGRVNCLPSENIRVIETWDGDDCRFEVRGTTPETEVLGENLQLDRRLWTFLGSSSLWLEDTVTNLGSNRSPHMILYHCNVGFPLLSAGAKVYSSHRTIRPRDETAAKGLDRWQDIDAPTDGFAEQVFLHVPVACEDGLAAAGVINHAAGEKGLGLAVRFDPRELPAFQSWKMLDERTYVQGLEPANCPDEGRSNAIREGTLRFLDAGESRRYGLRFDILQGRTEIEDFISQISQVSREPVRG